MRLFAASLLAVLAITSGCGSPNGQQAASVDGCAAGEQYGRRLANYGTRFIPADLRRPMNQALGYGFTREAGGMAGQQVGCLLTAKDRQRATGAVTLAASTGRPQTWRGEDSGASGQTRVVGNSGNCRTVEQTITLASGERRTEQVEACRGSGGGWQVST